MRSRHNQHSSSQKARPTSGTSGTPLSTSDTSQHADELGCDNRCRQPNCPRRRVDCSMFGPQTLSHSPNLSHLLRKLFLARSLSRSLRRDSRCSPDRVHHHLSPVAVRTGASAGHRAPRRLVRLRSLLCSAWRLQFKMKQRDFKWTKMSLDTTITLALTLSRLSAERTVKSEQTFYKVWKVKDGTDVGDRTKITGMCRLYLSNRARQARLRRDAETIQKNVPNEKKMTMIDRRLVCLSKQQTNNFDKAVLTQKDNATRVLNK
ncbi:hypothetical protein BLNAU_17118 [Blattamonas nauphoetae]|uniref:Uncharacterized protein n=1 Tax=Blattamonas nauphoetae TaxID=2049346 RepID=A0ABQ9XAV1_9EUKA|nr:hypothetical protein BLNAU_17118 [Blattamonas nauphoetae]